MEKYKNSKSSPKMVKYSDLLGVKLQPFSTKYVILYSVCGSPFSYECDSYESAQKHLALMMNDSTNTNSYLDYDYITLYEAKEFYKR